MNLDINGVSYLSGNRLRCLLCLSSKDQSLFVATFLTGISVPFQALQDSVLAERSAAQADLAVARKRLEEMRNARLREREAFLVECEAERKALSAERKAVGDAKEQVCLAEAELDVRIAQHEAKVKVGPAIFWSPL